MKGTPGRESEDRATARPRVGPGAYIAPQVRLASDAQVGPGAVILAAEDLSAPPTIVHRGAAIGANATILAGLTVGAGARVGPGAVVTRSVPPLAIVEGNPARIVGYVDAGSTRTGGSAAEPLPIGARPSRVRGVTVHQLPTASDMRGTLSAAEFEQDVPFQPARCYFVYGVPSAETRGEHAHRRCHQLLVVVSGTVRIVADDAEAREEFLLDSPSVGLLIPAMTWGIQYGHSPGAVLLVLASEHYDPGDYIRDYAEFVALARVRRGT